MPDHGTHHSFTQLTYPSTYYVPDEGGDGGGCLVIFRLGLPEDCLRVQITLSSQEEATQVS